MLTSERPTAGLTSDDSGTAAIVPCFGEEMMSDSNENVEKAIAGGDYGPGIFDGLLWGAVQTGEFGG